MRDKLIGTIHEILDSKKAVIALSSMVASVLTWVLGLLIAHYGPKLGLPPEVAARIPEAATWITTSLIGLAGTYCIGQGFADQGKSAAEIGAAYGRNVAVGTPDFKANLQTLAVEALKAAIDQQIPKPASTLTVALAPGSLAGSSVPNASAPSG